MPYTQHEIDNTYYYTYLKIGWIILLYSLASFYSFHPNTELVSLIIFLIFDIFLFAFIGHSFYTLVLKKNDGLLQFASFFHKISWTTFWAVIPISIALLFVSHSMMISVFNNLHKIHIADNNDKSIPLSKRNHSEFQRYKMINIIVFFMSMLLFCFLLNDWLPKTNYTFLYNKLIIFAVASVAISILGQTIYMIYMSKQFLVLGNRKLLLNN
uniref:Uncharacterized protein n=1 Tax=viral metagenome TaxID=1070528 RepID=A0A6C0DQ59_9ZZZZ